MTSLCPHGDLFMTRGSFKKKKILVHCTGLWSLLLGWTKGSVQGLEQMSTCTLTQSPFKSVCIIQYQNGATNVWHSHTGYC